MSTIKSQTEHLTLNADGSGKEIKFQCNGTEVAKIDSTGFVGAGSPSIDDNGNAIAITISSAEKVSLGGSTAVTVDSQVAVHGGNLELTSAGARYWIPRASDGALTGSLYSPSGSAIRLSGAGTSSGSIEFEPSSTSGASMTIDNSGIVTIPNQPSFMAKGTGTNYGSSGIVGFPTEVFDIGNNYSSNRFTAPVAGVYAIHWTVKGQSAGQSVYCQLRKNGSQYGPALEFKNSISSEHTNQSFIGQLNANDYIEIQSAVNVKTDSADAFSAILIG